MAQLSVFNGFFRSGTTWFFRIIAESNPDLIVLYEPFHRGIWRTLLNTIQYERKLLPHEEVAGRIGHALASVGLPQPKERGKQVFSGMIGTNPTFSVFNPWEKAYCSEKFKNHFDSFTEFFRYYGSIYSPYPRWQHVKMLFDVCKHIGEPVLVQANRLHTFLDLIYDYYHVPIIHIVRDPVEVFISFTHSFLRTTRRPWCRMWSFIEPKDRFFTDVCHVVIPKNTFGLRDTYREAAILFPKEHAKFVDAGGKEQLLDMFLFSWTYFNLKAVRDAKSRKGIKILQYDDFCSRPSDYFDKISSFLNVRLDRSFIAKTRHIVRASPEFRNHFMSRVEELGLTEQVNEVLNAQF